MAKWDMKPTCIGVEIYPLFDVEALVNRFLHMFQKGTQVFVIDDTHIKIYCNDLWLMQRYLLNLPEVVEVWMLHEDDKP